MFESKTVTATRTIDFVGDEQSSPYFMASFKYENMLPRDNTRKIVRKPTGLDGINIPEMYIYVQFV